MVKASRIGCAVLAASAFVSICVARADTRTNSRPVIRGTGNDVSIVYRAPKAPPADITATAADPLTEAIRQKAAGASDAAIMDFLRLHQAALPAVVDADVVRDLRLAGAGDEVIALLSHFSAVDVGETAEGGAAPAPQASGEGDGGSYPDLVDMGYPFYGGGGFGYGGGWSGNFGGKGRFGHGSFKRQPSFKFGQKNFPKMSFPHPRPPSHGMNGMHGMHSAPPVHWR
jgi:hypothetical protein